VDVDNNDIENAYSKFIKEINEFRNKSDIDNMDDEVKPMDIRNSVVWTGKIPDIKPNNNELEKKEIEEKKENEILNKEKENDIKIVDNKGINIFIFLKLFFNFLFWKLENETSEINNNHSKIQSFSLNLNELDGNEKETIPKKDDIQVNININSEIPNQNVNQNLNLNLNHNQIPNQFPFPVPIQFPNHRNRMDEFMPVDYKVPLNPISDNKNVITSNPVINNLNSIPNLMTPPGILNPHNNTYYNTYVNPYAFNNPGLSYMNMQQNMYMNNMQRNYIGNILPNNFQGKIPINQYGNFNNYGNYPGNINKTLIYENYRYDKSKSIN
jgi:hypothetical protein